jgi:hypothetical protein
VLARIAEPRRMSGESTGSPAFVSASDAAASMSFTLVPRRTRTTHVYEGRELCIIDHARGGSCEERAERRRAAPENRRTR